MDKEEAHNHQPKENSNQQEILIIKYYNFYILYFYSQSNIDKQLNF